MAAAMLLALVPATAGSVSPVTPRLDQESQRALLAALAQAGIPEVAGSAVVVALLAVLSTGPEARRYRYREPYPHVPDVDAEAEPAGDGCARVRLTAMPKAEPSRPVAIRGTYCLLDRARYRWEATALSVEPR